MLFEEGKEGFGEIIKPLFGFVTLGIGTDQSALEGVELVAGNS